MRLAEPISKTNNQIGSIMKKDKSTMDKRERIERALNFDSPDRVPYVDSFQHAGLIHYYTDKKKSGLIPLTKTCPESALQ